MCCTEGEIPPFVGLLTLDTCIFYQYKKPTDDWWQQFFEAVYVPCRRNQCICVVFTERIEDQRPFNGDDYGAPIHWRKGQ